MPATGTCCLRQPGWQDNHKNSQKGSEVLRNRISAHLAAGLVVAGTLVSVQAMAFAAFSSTTGASLTSSVAMLDKAATGQAMVTDVCTRKSNGSKKPYTHVVTVKQFGAVAGVTGYELNVYGPDETLAAATAATPVAGGTVTLVLDSSDQTVGWTFVIRASRQFTATTWTSQSDPRAVPLTLPKDC